MNGFLPVSLSATSRLVPAMNGEKAYRHLGKDSSALLAKTRLRWALAAMDIRPGTAAYSRYVEQFMPLEVSMGFDVQAEEPVIWRPGRENNGIMLVTGASGSGKTEALKTIIASIARHGIPVIAVDFHGDLAAPGLTDVLVSGGVYGQAGVNPLSLEPAGIARVGLCSKIDRELARINRAVGRLGYKQKACLSLALTHAYWMRGITAEDRSSWALAPPTLGEVSELLLAGIREGVEGFQRNTLEACHQKVRVLAESPAFNHPNGLNVEVMKANNMRLDFSTLSRPAQVLAAETVLEMVYEAERARGSIPVPCSSDAERFRLFLVVDEAKILTLGRGDASRADHIVNILATEGRKFGIGLILASQVADHFGDDVHAIRPTRLVMKNMGQREAKRVAPTIGVPASLLEAEAEPGSAMLRSNSVGGLVELEMRMEAGEA